MSFRDAPLGADRNPEMIRRGDSGFALRAPRNDECNLLSLGDALGLNLGRRLRLLRRLEAGAVDGAVDVVDQPGDARGVAAEIALEIARGGADIDARSLAVGRHTHRHVLAESHDWRPRHRL